MLDTAIRLMQSGLTPSVSDVAEAAEVSRATAYRYFPSQAAMIQAVVDEALGPILGWSSDLEASDERVADLLAFAYPRILDYEATHRAALLLALDQWARRQAGTIGTEERVVRGNRRGLLKKALAPLEAKLTRQAFDKVAQSLSLIFGIEAIVVLKDIWGLEDDEARTRRRLGGAGAGADRDRRGRGDQVVSAKAEEESGGKTAKSGERPRTELNADTRSAWATIVEREGNRMSRKNWTRLLAGAAFALVSAPALAQDKPELTIFWAEWDPANYLQELVNEYPDCDGHRRDDALE